MAEFRCPDRETLEQLLQGRLPTETAEQLGEHLLQCDDCLQVVETITFNDALTSALQPGQVVEAEDEILTQIIERSKQLRSKIETVESEETIIADERRISENEAESGISFDSSEIDFLHPPQAPDEIGRLGGYRVLEVIGVGGMGVVFRAEDLRLRRQVALKAMKPAIAASASAKGRFLKEAEATAAIEHDHIVTIFQVGEDRGIPFIAMRYLHGESLEDRINRKSRVGQREVVRLGRQIALGLTAAHQRGLIHRDIKPGNIWLESKQGRVKIVDFGLVRSMSQDSALTQTGMVVGTPKYMAPEQAEGQTVDHRCDLYSLGSVLYHLASGKAPFQGPNLNATLLAVAQANPTPVETLCPDLHPDLAALIMRLLSKEPAERPQTATEVVDVLEEIDRQLDALAHAETTILPSTVPEVSGETAKFFSRIATKGFKRPPRPRWKSPGALWCLLGGALLAGIIFIVTAKGTVTINIADKLSDDVKVEILDAGETVAVLDQSNHWTVKLPGGRYQLDMQGGDDEFALKEDRLTVSLFGRSCVKVDSTSSADNTDAEPPLAELYTRDREAAEWALYHGGNISISHGGDPAETHRIASLSKLPEEPFQLLHANLFGNREISGSDISVLTGLPSLGNLTLNRTSVGPEVLPYLTACPRLQYLDVVDTRLKGSDFAEFDDSVHLQFLAISAHQVDAGWEFLDRIVGIRQLNLTDAHALTAGQDWHSFSRLHTLILVSRRPINPEFIPEIQDANPELRIIIRGEGRGPDQVVEPDPCMSAVRTLAAIGYTMEGITYGSEGTWTSHDGNVPTSLLGDIQFVTVPADRKADLENWRLIPRLSWNFWTINAKKCQGVDALTSILIDSCVVGRLELTNSDLSDAGLAILAESSYFKFLSVEGTQVTRSGIEDFKRRNPACTVYSDFGTFEYEHRLPEGWNRVSESANDLTPALDATADVAGKSIQK